MSKEDPAPAVYRESRTLAPPAIGWLLMLGAAILGGRLAWSAFQGQTPLLLSLPGLIAMLAIGLGAVVARQEVRVTQQEVLIGNSPRLAKRLPLARLQRVEKRDNPPASWRERWPFGRLRIYSVDSGPGVLLSLADGEAVFVSSIEPDRLVSAIAGVAPHVVVGESDVRSGTTSR